MAEIIDFILELLAVLISPINKYDKWLKAAVKITGSEAELIIKTFLVSLKEYDITELKYSKLLIKKKNKGTINIIALDEKNNKLYSCNLKYISDGSWKYAYI